MDCREARDLLLETLTGTTPPDVRRRLAEHLVTCEVCRSEASTLEETAVLLRAVPEPRLLEGHWAEFMAALDRRLEADRQQPWARVRRWVRTPLHAWSTAVATSAVVVALGLALLGHPVDQARISTIDQPASVQVQGLMTDAMVKTLPAMNASLAVWKAGLGASEVPYELDGGE